MNDTWRVPVMTVVLSVVFVGSALTVGDIDPDRVPLDVALLAANTVPLLALRRAPGLVVAVFCAAYPAWIIAGHDGHLLQSLPTLTALYAFGSSGRPLAERALGVLAPAWMFAASAVGWWEADVLEIGYVAVVFVVVWALGVVMAARRDHAAELEARTVALETARRELADRAVADERTRIARELHDVIAHAMSVITVRAGVGAHLLTTDPDQAAEALGVIERTGREALDELRRMLTVLRDPDGGDAPAGNGSDLIGPGATNEPQPGLGSLPRLVDRAAGAGIPATLTIEGPARALPAGLDLAAYRVAQEALTNVAKHAPGARAQVIARYGAGFVEIEVSNNGDHLGGPVTAGLGLRGMAERVALYDGQLHAGADPRGGFQVLARFPTPTADRGVAP